MTGGIDYDYEDTHQDAHVPEPGSRRRRSGLRKISGLITGILAICLFFTAIAGGGFIYLKSEFEQAGPMQSETTVMINRGEGSRIIAEKLYKEGAISNDRIFLLGLLANRANGKLKAGEYRIIANASMQQIMEMLVAGKSIQYKITIPEGLTTSQVIDRILENEILVGEIGEDVPEGSLLPDTYNFTRGTTREDVVKRMQEAQNKLIEVKWPERSQNLPISTPHEAIILASIVEKETALASERTRVASVFVNRLNQNMRLQSDPTIVYGIVGGKGPLGRPIRKSDIAERTEYNTYQIDGLPPTPIANPGKAAIEAVLNPAETRDLFFVADGTGGHAFAETLAEHNRNVSRWRDIERQRNQPDDAVASDDTPDEPQAAEPDQTASLQSEPDIPANADLSEPDAVTPEPDTASPEPETASPEPETASPEPETASPEPDAASLEPEAASPEPDAASPAPDAAPNRVQPALSTIQLDPVPRPEPEADATETTASTPEPTVEPGPAQTPEPAQEPATVSEIAKAIIEKSPPPPKPKPPVPEQRTTANQPAPGDDPQSQVDVAPLPDVPADDTPADAPPPPATPQPQRQTPSPTDLR